MNQREPLSTEEIERLISFEMTAGLEYVYGPDNIAAERDRNYDYYRGIMNDLPAANGRSRVIEPTVANYIGLMKPSLLRIFTAGRNIVEYVSPKPEMQQQFKLLTRFINDVVFKKDNRGELMLGDWGEDGLIQKLGTVKGWWEEKWEPKDEILENIPDEQLVVLAQEIRAQGAEIVEHTSHPPMAEGAPFELVPGRVHSVKVRTQVNKSKVCIDVIPPEEYVISRDARNDDDAVLQGHRTGMMAGDLIAVGYPEEIILALPSYTAAYDRRQKYNQDIITNSNRDSSPDKMLRKVGVFQGILRCDYDGSGIREWYVVTGGDEAAPRLLEIEPYNAQVFFSNFCPEPMPHTVYGRCPADRLAMYQKICTVLVRQANDNIFLSNTPQREVVMDWIVKPDQLMNMAPGAPILVKQPNAIREISVPFVAEKALGMMAYYDGQAELTTGVGRLTGGLDADALQNQSATASNNQQSAMQGRIEMIARIWAQGGMRKLFRGVLKCLIAYQDFERVVQIDGAPQTISPEMFAGLEDIDVNINTGLGTGNRERDFAMLTSIALEQKEIIATLGPKNPIVDLKKAVRTLQLKAEAAGVNYPENFFGDPVNQDGSPWEPQPEEPQPTPDAVLLSEVENTKTAAKSETDANKLEFDREKTVAEIASKERIAMDKNARDYDLGLRQLGIEQANTIIRAAAVDADTIRQDMESKKKAEKKEPNIVIHSDARDGIEAALGEVKSMAAKMHDSHSQLHQEVAKLNRPKRIVRDGKGRATHSEAM